MQTPNDCKNCCQNCCQNCDLNNNPMLSMAGGHISKEHLEALPMLNNISGGWGPLSWEIDIDIKEPDISKDYFRIKLMFFGTTILNENFSETHPEIDVNLTLFGVGLTCTVGVDYTKRIVFLRGNLNFVVYSKQFDLTLYKF